MRKGKYYRYSLKILHYLFEKEPNETFNLDHRCAGLADKLIIPKTSFFDVLRILEKLEYISITRAKEFDVHRHGRYDLFIVNYFQKVLITTAGIRFYVSESDLTRT